MYQLIFVLAIKKLNLPKYTQHSIFSCKVHIDSEIYTFVGLYFFTGTYLIVETDKNKNKHL